jgi:hypothetical protein
LCVWGVFFKGFVIRVWVCGRGDGKDGASKLCGSVCTWGRP